MPVDPRIRLLVHLLAPEALPKRQLLHHQDIRPQFPAGHHVIRWLLDPTLWLPCPSGPRRLASPFTHRATDADQLRDQCLVHRRHSPLDVLLHPLRLHVTGQLELPFRFHSLTCLLPFAG